MTPRLPTLFVPHGAPTFALEPGAAGVALARVATTLPRPRALIIISAHWNTDVPTVGTATRPETIHDFWGFPAPLYTLRYPAAGCPEAAEIVCQAINMAGLPVETSPTQGLDHGAWIPLRLMFPDADIPVIPLSLQSRGGPAQALALGRALADLPNRGFLIIASGNLTHNLMDFRWASAQGGQVPPYVTEFTDWFADKLEKGDLPSLLDYRQQAPAASRAHPTDEHLLPLYVALGAAGDFPLAERFHAGIDHYVIAMDAWQFRAR